MDDAAHARAVGSMQAPTPACKHDHKRQAGTLANCGWGIEIRTCKFYPGEQQQYAHAAVWRAEVQQRTRCDLLQVPLPDLIRVSTVREII